MIGTLGAVGMAKRAFRLKNAAETMISLPIMIPEIVLGMAFLAVFTFADLPMGMPTLVIAHTTFCVPYIFILVKGRLAGMDPALLEAARDLGANERRAFFDITLPLITPGIVSGALLAFAMSMDDFVISFFVTGATTTTLPIKVYSSVKMGVSPQVNALCTLIMGVVFIAVALSRYMTNAQTNIF